MKRILLVLTLGLALGCSAWANPSDSTNAPSAGGPFHGGRGPMLTDAERQELMAAHEAALKADPSLETEQKELMEKMQALRKKIDDAMIKADPKVAPILAKLEANRPRHEGRDGSLDDKPKPPGN